MSEDRLGKLILRDDFLLQQTTLHDLLRHRRGTGNLTTIKNIRHPAAHLVQVLSKTGSPVVLKTLPWTTNQRDAAVKRGPHKSAHEHIEFLREEMADMVERATWVVMYYRRLRELKDLRVSPMGVVPQHERRPRPIVDYTFSGINDETVPLSPREAMQFGRALERIIAQVVHSNPKFGPVQFLKIDIADGFYRVWLKIEDVVKLGVAIPSRPGEEPLIALPLALPMGWTQSPPAFCAVTETIADVANQRLRRHASSPPHRLDDLADSPPTDEVLLPFTPVKTSTAVPDTNPLIPAYQRRLGIVDVFVDDFIGAAQGGRKRLVQIRRVLMQAIDDVFRPLSSDDPVHRTEPISVKKLLKGDASWSTCKKVLGWIIDSVSMTLTLPERRLRRLADILADIPSTQKRLALEKWHKLLGELRSMAIALPGARGLFSHLQAALRTRNNNRLRLTAGFHQALDDFRWLHDSLGDRPTRLQELVPTTPGLLGTHDASGLGAGGIWIPHPTTAGRAVKVTVLERDGHLHRQLQSNAGPIVWRHSFPSDVQKSLVSFANPQGNINNSELELVGGYLHDEVGAQCYDIRERTIKSGTDNLSTLYWSRKGSATTTSPTATILRQQALHQRYHRYLGLKDYFPGINNKMADDASRLFHLDDHEFLTYFNFHYPQATPWRLFQIHQKTILSATSALRTKTSPMEWFLHAPKKPLPTGPSGRPTATNSAWILPYKTSKIPSLSSKSSPGDSELARSIPVNVAFEAGQWKVPYAALAKRSPAWGPRTPATLPKANSTFASNA
jgi:hypothetical protein